MLHGFKERHITAIVGLGAFALAGFLGCSATKNDESSGTSRGAAVGDPKGNNGTVKIQEAGAVDELPDNDPHVGCIFHIEFRGFDEGDLTGTWTLSAQAPSGTATIAGPTEVAIGGDAAGGANDLDALVVVNIADYDLSALEEHPNQGYHLKLEAHAEGSIGADTKFKVFWVQGCAPEEDAGTGSSSSGGSSSGGSSSGGSSSGGKTW